MNFGEYKQLLWDNLKDQTFLDGDSAAYPKAVLWTATIGALRAILPWVPKASVQTLTVATAGNTLALPADTYLIDAIHDPKRGYLINHGLFKTGNILHNPATQAYSTTGDLLFWLEYPLGTLWFSQQLAAGQTLNLFYRASWPEPINADDDTYEFSVPKTAWMGMLYYSLSHAILPSSASSAQIRQFNTRIDSGTPVDNVLEQASKHFRALFLDEMARLPKYRGAIE